MKNITLMLLFIIPIANYGQIPQRLREAQELQIYEENGLKGVKDRNGNIILTPQYYAIEYAGDGRWEIEDTSCLSGFIDKYGKIIVPPKYSVPYDKYNEGFCFVENNEGGTYIDRQGNPLTAFIYKEGGFFSEGLGAVRGKNGKWGFIDSYGVEVIPCIYDFDRTHTPDAPFFNEGLACVSKRGKTMYIDKRGKIFLKLPKDHYSVRPWYASNYNNGKALILDENLRLAFIDKQGNVTPKNKYKRGYFLEVFNNGFCIYQDVDPIVLNMDLDPVARMIIRGDKWIKQADKWIEKKDTTLQHSSEDAVFHLANFYLELHHDRFHVDAFWLLNNIPNNSKAQCSLGDMYYYGIGVEKNEVKAIAWYKKSNEPEAKKQLAMIEGNASNADIVTVTDIILQKNEDDTKDVVKESVLQKDSIAQIPRLYINEDEYYVKGGKAYNRQGKLVLSSEKYLIKSYSDGRFRVISQNNLYGFVDILGNEIIPCQYEDARDFRDGVARVCKKIASDRVRKWGYIDKNGKQVLPFSYGHVSGDFSQGLAYVAKSNQSSIINKKGEIVKKLKISNYNLTPPGDQFLPRVANYTYFSEGVIWLSVGNRLFLVNTNGDIEKEIDLKEIEKAFNGKLWEVDEVYPFKRGLSLLRFEDYDNKIKIGYLYNKDGNVVAKYDFVNNKVFDEYKSDTTAIVKMAEYFYDNDRLDSSLELFRQASSLGNSRAQYIVGFMYQYGQGTKVNEQEAIKWYTKSNEPEAKKQLAMIESKEKIQEPIKKEEPILLADTKVQNNNSEIVTPQTPVESKTVIAKTSQDKIVAQNTSQAQEQSKQPTPVEKKKEERIALVIGNSDYPKDPLSCARNDALDITSKFRKCDIQTKKEENVRYVKEFENLIEVFCDSARTKDVAIFYYSGHGRQYNGRNYLIPTQADYDEYSIVDRCLSLNWILQMMDNSGVKTKIIILDACRENHNPGWKKGKEEQGLIKLGREGLPTGTFIMYAAQPGAAAWGDKDIRNSYFTAELLKLLDDPQLNIHELMRKVRINVEKTTKNKQSPDYDERLNNDFYFNMR